jgi:UDP-galactopyranose mutase
LQRTREAAAPALPEVLAEAKPDLVVLSHLRWDFVYQRPQHLMSRFARERRVFFFEEPMGHDGPPRLVTDERAGGVVRAVPHLPHGMSTAEAEAAQGQLLAELADTYGIAEPVLWYYTPMAVTFTSVLTPQAVVYDCMDELSLFRGAPPDLLAREERLLASADLVFTGGTSLYEAKRGRHRSVHAFPSSIDAAHFARAREKQPEPADQAGIPRPRLGYFGVIDERIDLDLLAALADARPEWHIVMVGPVVKIDPAALPQRANLHYLGMKSYAELPAYLAGWDVALMPFARNEATRFISPTKTPEYLAGGRPVVSTSIKDVVHPYGEQGLVEIADEVGELEIAIGRCLDGAGGRGRRDHWQKRVDEFLADGSWDRTFRCMSDLIDDATAKRRRAVG